VDLDSRTLVTNNSQQPRSFISSNDNRQLSVALLIGFSPYLWHTRKDGTTPFRLLAVGATAYVPATSDPASHTRIGIQRRTRTRASQPGASASLHPADSRTQCDRSKVTLSSIYSPLAHFSKMPGKEISFFLSYKCDCLCIVLLILIQMS